MEMLEHSGWFEDRKVAKDYIRELIDDGLDPVVHTCVFGIEYDQQATGYTSSPFKAPFKHAGLPEPLNLVEYKNVSRTYDVLLDGEFHTIEADSMQDMVSKLNNLLSEDEEVKYVRKLMILRTATDLDSLPSSDERGPLEAGTGKKRKLVYQSLSRKMMRVLHSHSPAPNTTYLELGASAQKN